MAGGSKTQKMRRLVNALTRKKTLDNSGGSELARVLSLLDLSALGVGSTLGLGVYVLAGSVARKIAGPAVCISFLIAAVASGVAGLCYAEFAARVPKAGSAYVYSYVSVGEVVAYVIGWNLILEYAIGTASVARGLSGYIDALANQDIKNFMESWAKMDVGFLASYPDFLAFGFVVLLTALLSIGVKESSRLNNIFTGLNLITVGIVIVSGAIKADSSNWNKKLEDIPDKFREDAGTGGFMPFGVSGMMEGAAQCFYGFVGFDAVATTGEEAKNPQRNIPLAIVISLLVIFLAYFGISTVLTMMWPYYDQDPTAPFPYVFDQLGWPAIKWIVTIGAVIALCTSLLGALFPLPRIIYAMSNDGLIFKFLAKINPKTKTPIIATVLSGILVGAMAILFDTDQLISMMSIGTLLAYTIVAVCVLILRYQPTETQYPNLELKQNLEDSYTLFGMFKQLFNLNMTKYASSSSAKITNWSIILFAVFTAAFDAFIIYAIDVLDKPYYMTLFIVVTLVMLTLVVIIARQPVDEVKLSFKVPWVPFVPCLSIIINLYLMLELDKDTWIRFGVWLFIGFLIYFFYGIENSEERKLRKLQAQSNETNKQITKF
ncbi:high affinity cationic amino acid transporter 1 isoform X1 [Tribolium castaneum]|uniref:high affinity cationic amino acid transporter 1 isoform X1 n=2 Tax=Tribolium castaneum TaxID=7070 RepID=UPI0030FE4446